MEHMSFAKAQDLLRLAQMAAHRRGGVCLDDICAEFTVSHRTAQRMTEALQGAFANVTTTDAPDRRRYWRLDAPPPDRLQPRQETTIEALDIAIRAARDEGRMRHASLVGEGLDHFRNPQVYLGYAAGHQDARRHLQRPDFRSTLGTALANLGRPGSVAASWN